jgi:hypothetical protein
VENEKKGRKVTETVVVKGDFTVYFGREVSLIFTVIANMCGHLRWWHNGIETLQKRLWAFRRLV